MATTIPFQTRSVGCGIRRGILRYRNPTSVRRFTSSYHFRIDTQSQPTPRANDEVAQLAASRRRPLTLADLLK